MSPDGRRALGYGLLAGAAGVAILLLAWLAVSGVQAGGFVLGLLLLFVLAGPLAGAGWYVLARGRADAVEERVFAGKRRVLDADRLFRNGLAVQLGQLAALPTLSGGRLSHIAEQVERATRDESAWYDAIQLDDAQTAVLAHYDDLVWQRVRWLRDHASAPAQTLDGAIDELQAAMDQRTDLLLRGRRAPEVSPVALLHGPGTAPGSTALTALTVGDAVTYAGDDYLVDGVATGFSDGQTFKLGHLVPSGAGGGEQWLSISPAGLELGWLESVPAPAPGAAQLVFQGVALDLVDARSSIVDVVTQTRSAPGVLVRSWTYRAGPRLGLVEQWPDQTVRAYAGHAVAARDLEVWPATQPQPVADRAPSS